MNKAKKGTNMAKNKQLTEEMVDNALSMTEGQDDLMAFLGISSGQIEEESKTKKSSLSLTNRDALRDECNVQITDVVKSQGTKISFTSYKPNGWVKDANGKPVLDANGKKKHLYKSVDVSGFFVIDPITETVKDAEGNERKVKLFRVSKPIVYTDAFDIADYTELS